MYSTETITWTKRNPFRIRAQQIAKLRGFLGIRRMDKVPNAWIRKLCRVAKGVDERPNEGVLRWFGHVDGLESDMIVKRVYVGEGRECVSSRSVDRTRKEWIDITKDYIKPKGVDVRQGRRMVYEKSEWRGFVKGNI